MCAGDEGGAKTEGVPERHHSRGGVMANRAYPSPCVRAGVHTRAETKEREGAKGRRPSFLEEQRSLVAYADAVVFVAFVLLRLVSNTAESAQRCNVDAAREPHPSA